MKCKVNNLDIIIALGYLSDEVIAETDEIRSRQATKKRLGYVKYVAIAACAAIVIFAAFNIGKGVTVTPDPVSSTPISETLDAGAQNHETSVPEPASDISEQDSAVPERSSEDFRLGFKSYHSTGIYDNRFVSAKSAKNTKPIVELLSENSKYDSVESFYIIRILEVLDADKASELAGYSFLMGDSESTFYRAVIEYDCFEMTEVYSEIVLALPGTVENQIEGMPPFSVTDRVALLLTRPTDGSQIRCAFAPETFSYMILDLRGFDYALAFGKTVPEVESGLIDYSNGDMTWITTTTDNPAAFHGCYDPDILSASLKDMLSGGAESLMNPVGAGYSEGKRESVYYPLTGGDYVLDLESSAPYGERNVVSVSVSDEKYGSVMQGVEATDLRLLEYEIVAVYSPDEGGDIINLDEIASGQVTLYRARVMYDYVADRETDYYIYTCENGGIDEQVEGFAPYTVGERLLSAVTYYGDSDVFTSVDELRFKIYDVNGQKLAYHMGYDRVSLSRNNWSNLYPNLVLDMSDSERSVVVSTSNNPDIYTQKSTVASLVSFLLDDWKTRGIISDTGEIVLSGLKNQINAPSEPIYSGVTIIPADHVNAQSYDILAESFGENLRAYAFEILSSASDGDGHTVYHARAYYDGLEDIKTNFEFDILRDGDSKRQTEDCPVYGVGRRYFAVFDNWQNPESSANTPVRDLEFEIYEMNGIEFAYHMSSDIRLEGDYINLDLELSDSEREVVTTTADNPVRYTQKSTLASLVGFLRDDFTARGYLSVKPILKPGLETGGMGFEGIMLTDFNEWQDANPWFGLEDELYGATIPAYADMVAYAPCGGFPSFMYLSADREYMVEQLGNLAKIFGEDISEYEIQNDAPSENELERIREKCELDVEQGWTMHSKEDIDAVVRDYALPNEYYIETSDGLTLSVVVESIGYYAKIEFNDGVDLGIGNFEDNDPKAMRRVGEVIAEKYGYLVPGEGEIRVAVEGGDQNIYGNVNFYNLFLYRYIDGDPIGTLLNYSFRKLNIFADDGKLNVLDYSLDRSYEELGNYEIIVSEGELLDRLEEGKFLTTAPIDDPKVENIASIELMYRNDGLPYFKFWIDITDQLLERSPVQDDSQLTYGAYYIPAVTEDYIDGSTPWDGSFNFN